jgi:hypothetical protein
MSSRTSRTEHGHRSDLKIAVVRELGCIRDTGESQLVIRVLKLERGGLRVDVRELVKNERFHGFTKRGLCLRAEEFHELLRRRAEIEVLLAGRGAPPVDRQRREEAMS